jgi:hypothetical protein
VAPEQGGGVVAYWSSHLDGAQSTRIVPSGHGTHQNPEGIAEVRRILLLHLHERSSARYPAASSDVAGDEGPDAVTDQALSQVIDRPLPRLVDGDGGEPGAAVVLENHSR